MVFRKISIMETMAFGIERSLFKELWNIKLSHLVKLHKGWGWFKAPFSCHVFFPFISFSIIFDYQDLMNCYHKNIRTSHLNQHAFLSRMSQQELSFLLWKISLQVRWKALFYKEVPDCFIAQFSNASGERQKDLGVEGTWCPPGGTPHSRGLSH